LTKNPVEKELLDVIERVATRLAIKNRARVRLSFAIHPEEDGGPGWSIDATRASPYKRKVDESFHAGGATLAEAVADFMVMMDRRENSPAPRLPPDLQALVDAARQKT